MEVRRINSDTAFIDYVKSVERRVAQQETKPAGDIVIQQTLTTTDPNTGVSAVFGTLDDGTLGFRQFLGDTTPPPVPSTPIVSSALGTVTVIWNGTYSPSGSNPPDYSHINAYGQAVTGTSPSLLGTMINPNDSLVYSNLITGDKWTFWLTSVDQNGNESAASTPTGQITIASVLNDAGLSAQLANTQVQINTANAAILTKNSVFSANTAPTGSHIIGDVWFDTSNGNKPMIWSGSVWTSSQDAAIATAQSTANGKNTVTYSVNPASGSGIASGDIWFQTSAGIIIGQWQWSGSAWVSQTIGNSVIANLDAAKITTGYLAAARIQAQTITSTMIAASTIVGGNIAASTITANNIAASTITATQIAGQTITSTQIAASTIVAGNIAAGAIIADHISVGAIDGKIITGATVQTASSGARIVLDTTGLNGWDGGGNNYFNVTGSTGVTIMSTGYAGYDMTRTNWCTNPGMETDISGWTSAQTIARDTAQFYQGAASLKATWTSTADRTVTRIQGATSLAASGTVLSAYVRHDAATSKSMHVNYTYLDAGNNPVSGGSFVGSTISVAPNTWTRLSVTATYVNSVNVKMDIIGTSFASTENMWVDAVLCDVNTSTLGAYFDGDTTFALPTYYVWDATAKLSVSEQRLQRTVKIKTGGNSVFTGPGGLTTSPGVGFIPPNPYLQTAGLYSDGQSVSLYEGSSDPNCARIVLGNQAATVYAWGLTSITGRGGVDIEGQNGVTTLNGSTIAIGTGGQSTTINGRAVGFASYVEWIQQQTGVPNQTLWGVGTPTSYSRSTNTTMTSALGSDNITFNVSGIYVISFLLNVANVATGRTFCEFGMSYTSYKIARNNMGVGDDTVSATATVRVNSGETVNFTYYQTSGGTTTATTKIRITRISDI